MVGAVAVRL